MPMYRSLNHGFFKIYSPEMSYILGFFVADGSMIRNKRGAHFIEFQITDLGILRKIKKTMNSGHKISICRKRKANWKQCYRLQLGSKEMFNDLRKLGLTQAKSKTLKMPKVPDRYLGHFVRGYFDGDGCINSGTYRPKDRKGPKFTYSSVFTSGSQKFLEELHKLLKKKGIKGFINKKTKAGKISGYGLIFSHKSSLALYDLMYNNDCRSLYLERKKKKFDKIVKRYAVVAQLG